MREKVVARKKLYKAKKSWVVAGLTTAFLMVNQASVSADQNVNDTSVTTTTQDVTTDQDTGIDASVTTTVSPNLDDTQVDNINIQASTDQKDDSKGTTQTVETDVTTNSQSTDTTAVTAQTNQTETIQNSDATTETGLVTVNNQVRYVNPDGTVLKGAYKTINGNTYYFDDNSGDALIGIHKIGESIKGFGLTGVQIKGDYLTAVNGDKYYFDSDGNTVSGVQQINGKTYYFDSTGKLMKGYTAVLSGVVTFFNSTTGEADNTDASTIKTGVTIDNSDYTTHNAAYDNTAASFDNINGYLTAESWYRPKEILENGESWRPSTTEDKRPILITWQPDIVTEVNYLNMMAANGLLSINAPFTTASDLAIMNDAVRAVQKNIEIRISQEKSTDWLKTLMTQFINTQPQWNEVSESPSNDHLQGGALTYVNSPLTPDANSNFRLLNRTPTNQSGTTRYDTDKSEGGFELLLANDVDNSNPVVQAEQLNWLYYLMNFGSITANDPTANFDGIRVDAVDNVDADLLQIASDYFKLAYGTSLSDTNANQHLSILEDWSANDAEYMSKTGSNQLTMDTYTQQQLLFSLTKTVGNRADMRRFLEYFMINRANDATENVATPNYSFVRAHDSEVQTVIATIIKDLHPDVVNSLAPTQAQLEEAFAVYNADMNRVDKQYTQYNMPSAYA
ncbi:MAG: glycoside hydrolase family 70 protein, partial [Leuconostoc falkenbergense]